MPFRAKDKQATRLAHDFAVGFNPGADFVRDARAFRFVRYVFRRFGEAGVKIAAKLDVRASARHVGGDRYRAGLAGLRDNRGFLFVIAGVQDAVGNFPLL